MFTVIRTIVADDVSWVFVDEATEQQREDATMAIDENGDTWRLNDAGGWDKEPGE